MFKKSFSLVGIILMLCACTSETASDLIKTKGIWAGFELVSDGSRTRINAELNAGDMYGSNIVLSDSDTLQVIVRGTAVELSKDTDFLDVDYQAYINITDDNEPFDILFNRDDEISTRSTVELPHNFIILTPSSEQNFSITNTITVQLDGIDTNSASTIELSSHCTTNNNSTLIQSTSSSVTSSSYSFNLNNLIMFNDTQIDKSKACNLTILVERVRSGAISGEFASQSYIQAKQQRTINNMTLTF
ncbi:MULTISPECIES: hypothetical protein [Pseudoalteromonas]|uniref:Lipoprotein n=1 Tax=Pseudoalteromonas fuliginea TaxID=1872678 RepID=A0ABD3Y6W0_9GAMM|nr:MULTISPECIES: hypothetical protein [Pseudoalteromonas]KDC49717.1 hypothetical protein DC53_15320 [Pseudoalteromonas fuliginea]KDC54531.1 hypothetical protein DO88_08305 [Pseudoalteromonas sp. S3431]KJZ26997.1 hypothetical protein TW82_14535 [Pseudoalteromonas fuliginea]